MRRIATLLLSLLALGCMQAKNVAEYFGDIKADEVFPSLSSVARLDMVDYFNSGMTNPTKNELGSFSRITALSDTMMSVDYTTGVRLELTLLPGKKPVLMLIETLPLPENDSRISFYNADWKPLKKTPLKFPGLTEWLNTRDLAERESVEMVLPFMLCTASFDPLSQDLVLTSTIDSYFAKEKPKILSLLRKSLVYHWDGKNFKPVKTDE